MIPNEKLKITPKEIGSILVAALATALCMVIDLILEEDMTENK